MKNEAHKAAIREAMAVHYVQISREEWEEWLDSTRLPWGRDENKKGVYYLMLNKEPRPSVPPPGVKGKPPRLPAGLKGTVAIYVSSSIGTADSAMGRGQAAIHMKLVSAVTGYALNKKAVGQSRFNRTKNWRATITTKGIGAVKQAYNKAKAFYDELALIADRSAYQDEMIASIEAIDGWANNDMLTSFRDRLETGGILTTKQREALQRASTGTSAPAEPSGGDPEVLEQMRDAYRAARAAGNQWVMDRIQEWADLVKRGVRMSGKRQEIIEEWAQKRSASRVAASHRRGGMFYTDNPRSVEDWDIYDKPGAGEAAAALTRALSAAKKELRLKLGLSEYRSLDPQWDRDDEKRLGRLFGGIYNEHMKPVLDKYDAFGTWDSEAARDVAAQVLIEIVKKKYRITGWFGLADYAY